MPDIVIAGAQFNSVPSISIPKAGGGMADFLDTTIASDAAAAADILSGKKAYVNGQLLTGTGSGGGGGLYPWMGNGAQKVGQVYTKTINLHSDTSYDSWTPSTSSTKIRDQSTVDDLTYTLDLNYDYLFVLRGELTLAYTGQVPTTSNIIKHIYYWLCYVSGYHSSNLQLGALGNVDYAYLVDTQSFTNGIVSYGQDGALRSTRTNYGPIFPYTQPFYRVDFSNNFGTFHLQEPQYNARCNSNYFATANAALVDSANTYWKNDVDLYRVSHANSLFGYWENEWINSLEVS